jgi:hypothetical protein
LDESVVHWPGFRQIFVTREKACSSGKALQVQAEDEYHSNIDASREKEGRIVNKLEQRHATI